VHATPPRGRVTVILRAGLRFDENPLLVIDSLAQADLRRARLDAPSAARRLLGRDGRRGCSRLCHPQRVSGTTSCNSCPISQGRASARTRSLQIFGSAIRNPYIPPMREMVRRRRCIPDHLQCTVARGRLDRVADAYLSASLDGTGIAGRERAAVPRSDAALDSRANHAPRTPILPRWTKPQNQSPQAIAPLIRETKCASDRKNLSSALRGMPTVSDILMLATRATGQSRPR
jgi:hypothetical protein